MSVILHITTRRQWDEAQRAGLYRGDTLDSEGFIHCSNPCQVISVANARFHRQAGLVLLCIDTARVEPDIRHEGAPGGERFPHIYGTLNLTTVTRVLPFETRPDGTFELPPELAGS